MKKRLNRNGHILIILENRLGLKYLSGFPSNHPFLSHTETVGQKSGTEIGRLTKYEIKEALKDFFHNISFYYLYPDHENVFEVFSDNMVNDKNYSSINNPTDNDICTVFDEKQINELLMINGVSDIFQNGFIVDATDAESTKAGDYIKISSNRNKEFALKTIINKEKKTVLKKAIYSNGTDHIEKIVKNSTSSRLKTLEYKWNATEKAAYATFLGGITLKDVLDSYVKNEEFDDFFRTLSDFRKWIGSDAFEYACYKDTGFVERFGFCDYPERMFLCGGNSNVDLMFDNIFIDNNKWIVVDPEWCFDFPLPINLVFFRAINNYYHSSEIGRHYDCEKIMMEFDISLEDIELFKRMDDYFVYNYVGSKRIDYKINNLVNVQEIYNRLKFIDADLQKIEVDFRKAEVDLHSAEVKLSEIEKSSSWKITKPLRKIKDLLRHEKK